MGQYRPIISANQLSQQIKQIACKIRQNMQRWPAFFILDYQHNVTTLSQWHKIFYEGISNIISLCFHTLDLMAGGQNQSWKFPHVPRTDCADYSRWYSFRSQSLTGIHFFSLNKATSLSLFHRHSPTHMLPCWFCRWRFVVLLSDIQCLQKAS